MVLLPLLFGIFVVGGVVVVVNRIVVGRGVRFLF